MLSRRRWVQALPFLAAAAAGAAAPRRIGFLSLVVRELQADTGRAFLHRLEQLGQVVGRNVVIEHREARQDDLVRAARELVALQPDVLVAGLGTLPALALKSAAGPRIPVVFCAVGDPVGAGLVAGFSDPGAQVTGIATQVTSVAGKRLQLAREMIHDLRRVAVLHNPATPATRLSLDELRRVAAPMGVVLEVAHFQAAADLEAAFEDIRRFGPQLLLVLEDPLSISLRREIGALVHRARLPAICGVREAAEAGCVASYGVSRTAAFARAAEYVDKILKGVPARTLPVEQVSTFDFVVNRDVARELQLALPSSWLYTATEVLGN
ncbi:ABC transporter substrate-binding protein [Ramlibacter albus]|uniref:ABC transporter substrate-binding protein n=1 Tax=Ramlibacter albus TaxID=2079448 RepID=A0A923S4A1_9BURK|nr:ABC transporter substrate-binding protein [Ramlibacter albus]MBC5767256.1 ABC transporter substrate-binding protein [Ramlibacter albus]